MDRLKDFWLRGWYQDKVATILDIISFIFTVGASASLAIHARDPNMALIYPAFFIGSVAAIFAYYRRGLAWPMALVIYFSAINVYGFGVALSIW